MIDKESERCIQFQHSVISLKTLPIVPRISPEQQRVQKNKKQLGLVGAVAAADESQTGGGSSEMGGKLDKVASRAGSATSGSPDSNPREAGLATMRLFIDSWLGSIGDGLETSLSLRADSSGIESAIASPSTRIAGRRNCIVRGEKKKTLLEDAKELARDWHARFTQQMRKNKEKVLEPIRWAGDG